MYTDNPKNRIIGMILLYIVAEKVKQFLRTLSNVEHIWQKRTFFFKDGRKELICTF